MRIGPGSRLGPYEVVASIGSGGMGEVFRARDPRLGREVAIKVLPPGLATDPERLRRFEQEARATAALSHHNILAVFDVGMHEGQPYLVEELLVGESLRNLLNRGALPPSRALEVALAIARGLTAAHEKGIVHRDLKPENVFLTLDGEVKVLDFGLAKLLRSPSEAEPAAATTEVELTRYGTVLGTAGYMSPEQVRGQAVDCRTDIFALGCVLYEMLSGRRAFVRETALDTVAAVLREDPPALSSAGGRISPVLQEIVKRCLEKRPQERFDSAHDLALALRAISDPPPSSPASGEESEESRGPRVVRRRLVRPTVFVPAVMVVVLSAWLGTRLYQRRAVVSWARQQALPEIMKLVDQHERWRAFVLARRVDAILPGDPLLEKLWPQFAAELVWNVTPAGAQIYARSPEDPDDAWIVLGRAGDAPLRTPAGCTVFRVEQPQSEPDVFAMSLTYSKGTLPLILRARGEARPGMARIDPPNAQVPDYPMLFDYRDSAKAPLIGSFLIDRYEVTNRDFKRFVDAGSYGRRELWKEVLLDEGRVVPWDEAIARFRDGTGRQGPVTWELGTYPDGKADYPVTGVSWYEAAAYAEFAGKRLPTVHHWAVASGSGASGCLIRGSNFSGQLAPVGSYRGSLNVRGLYDMAGNAREWCANAKGELRVTRGGACDGPSYLFSDLDPRPAFERNGSTGFRCIAPLEPAVVAPDLEQPLAPSRRWNDSQPFSDETWRTWLSFVSYQKTPLAARLERVDESSPYWRMEEITFDAAYGDERVLAYLFLPKDGRPPYQTIVFWPGATVLRLSTSDHGRAVCDTSVWGHLVRDGRAVLYPILKGTYDRGGGSASSAPREQWVMQVKDVFRSLDYLESRDDVDKERFGFMGFSWGAYMGTLACAADVRFKVAVLRCGGLTEGRGLDVLGWAHRMTIPVQMVNGRFDGLFPHENNQQVLFSTLGAAEKEKRIILFDTGHQMSGFEKETIRVDLEWFDRFLGPVRR